MIDLIEHIIIIVTISFCVILISVFLRNSDSGIRDRDNFMKKNGYEWSEEAKLYQKVTLEPLKNDCIK